MATNFNPFSVLAENEETDSAYASGGTPSVGINEDAYDPLQSDMQSHDGDGDTLVVASPDRSSPKRTMSSLVTHKPKESNLQINLTALKTTPSQTPQKSLHKAPASFASSKDVANVTPEQITKKTPPSISQTPTVRLSGVTSPKDKEPGRPSAATDQLPITTHRTNVIRNASKQMMITKDGSPQKIVSTTSAASQSKTTPKKTESIAAPNQASATTHPSIVQERIVRPVPPTGPRNPQFAPRRLPVQRFASDRNLPAVIAWRQRQPPVKVHELARNFDPSNQKTDAIRTRNGTHFPMLEHIASLTNTHLAIWRSSGKCFEVHIWGSPEDARNAIVEIDWWVKNIFGRTGTQKFVKIPRLTEDEWYMIEKKILNEEKRQRFRRIPAEGDRFADWAVTEVLGSGLEALDEIRMDCFSYIRFLTRSRNPGQGCVFEVLSNNRNRMLNALERLGGIIDQQDARQLSRPRWYLVRPCDATQLRKLVKLEKYKGPKPGQLGQQNPSTSVAHQAPVAISAVPLLHGPILSPDEREEREKLIERVKPGTVVIGGAGVESLNIESIEAVAMTTLKILTHYRGHLQMRASLGKFGLTNFPKEDDKPKLEYELNSFEDLLYSANGEENPMAGHVTKELGAPELEHTLLDRFKAAAHLLLPHDARSPRLSDVRPIYCVTFVIANLNQDGPHYQLELEFQDIDEKAEFRSKRWLRLDVNEEDLTSLMDINMINLEGPLSFNLSIAAANAVVESRLPAHYEKFASDVQVNLEKARDFQSPTAEECFFNYPLKKEDKNPTVPIVRMTQKRAWRFVLSGTDYVTEVATVQNVKFNPDHASIKIVSGNITKPPAPRVQPYEMRWSLQMWHQVWDMWLPGNKELELGEGAMWRAEESFLFPPDRNMLRSLANLSVDDEVRDMFFSAGEGFQALVEKLECLERIACGEEDGKGDGEGDGEGQFSVVSDSFGVDDDVDDDG
ncbi:hypothetical protein NA57DRAFT_79985 [Rhizodiscina lignyota]|uniref:DUF7905 domain-containing protein n=1 Tax=Rhizodiscina lignyota TaxID=1504668 RepID=A0A9P4I8T5_9PEZI|nr:hypothetical protein NA57DRAFT_79985 [Rhizodiscina lignyota]